jgi:hypothetical protein
MKLPCYVFQVVADRSIQHVPLVKRRRLAYFSIPHPLRKTDLYNSQFSAKKWSSASCQRLCPKLLNESPDTARLREQSALDELLKSTGGRVLFGAGSVGTRALNQRRSIGIDPLCFSDNSESRRRSTIDGCQVLSPTEAAGSLWCRLALHCDHLECRALVR